MLYPRLAPQESCCSWAWKIWHHYGYSHSHFSPCIGPFAKASRVVLAAPLHWIWGTCTEPGSQARFSVLRINHWKPQEQFNMFQPHHLHLLTLKNLMSLDRSLWDKRVAIAWHPRSHKSGTPLAKIRYAAWVSHSSRSHRWQLNAMNRPLISTCSLMMFDVSHKLCSLLLHVQLHLYYHVWICCMYVTVVISEFVDLRIWISGAYSGNARRSPPHLWVWRVDLKLCCPGQQEISKLCACSACV